MTAFNPQELQELLSAFCDNRLSPPEGERLAALLRSSPEARVAYVRYLDLHGSLDRAAAQGPRDRTSAGAPPLALKLDGVFDTELSPASADPSTDHHNQRSDHNQLGDARQWSFRGGAAIGLSGIVWTVATLACVSLLLPWRDARVTSEPPAAGDIVAQIVADSNCAWQDQERPFGAGASLRAGQQLTLTSGVARLRFDDATTVLAESPTSFELISRSSLRLLSGTVVLRAEGKDRDFTVLAPNTSIVDRGTSFGVHSGPDGIDIEVFEGKVEVRPGNDARRSQVLGLGASARVRQEAGGDSDIRMFAGSEGRFTDLLQMLWEDIRTPPSGGQAGDDQRVKIFPRAEFSNGESGGSVDSFYGATPGRGWVTPWVASGSPIGEVAYEDGLTGEANPYLKLRFFNSSLRTVAREYGPTSSFDPELPHVISWVWRFDGTDEEFGDSFSDRVAFYGNPYFRSNSSEDVTWFMGWTADHEATGEQRRTIPKRWFVFDGANGSDYGLDTLVDTGMELKRGVVYRMAVVLYPRSREYDAIIQDDEQTFVRARLGYRNQTGQRGSVLHFSVGGDPVDCDAGFSIDSIRVEQLRPDLSPSRFGHDAPRSHSTRGPFAWPHATDETATTP